jgi:hypothetical protein
VDAVIPQTSQNATVRTGKLTSRQKKKQSKWYDQFLALAALPL